MLRRLLIHVAETVLSESQCGFRRGRSTIDMIFIARLLQEKCREHHRRLYFAFIDLTKPFDTVNRDLFWKVLAKFDCSSYVLTMLREFDDGMKSRVVIGGEKSDSFEVLVGVKQECVLAPVIFNLLLVAVTLVFRNGLSNDVGIPFKYPLDGSMFNLRRLQAQTKVCTDTVFELQYADDAAIPSHESTDLQDN